MCKEDYRNEIQRVLAEQMNQEATNMEEALMAKYALACSHVDSGNMEAGYKCMKEIIETSLHVFGEDHALTSWVSASAVLTLARIAIKLGHHEEAFGWLNYVDRGLQNGAIERSYVVDVDLVHSFAIIYCSLGQFGKALPYAERSVQMYERYDDEGETQNKIEAKQIVATIYGQLGQRDKAVTVHKEMWKEAKKKLGSSHPATRLAKACLADLEDYWASGVDPSDVQAQMIASEGRKIATGFLHSIVNGKDLDSTPVEIRLFSPEKRQYLVQMAGGDRSQLYVNPSNIILDTDTPVHVQGLQNAKQYNGKEGVTRDYSNKNGRYTVRLGTTHTESKLITVKPENLIVRYQPDLVFDATSTWTLAQILSHSNACY
jgi:tetratricopeptide (TPR) repeat protein